MAFSLRLSVTPLIPTGDRPREPQRVVTFAPRASPRAIANVEFEDGQGRKRTLADFHGKVVLLELWATWCAPCREEMPTLDHAQHRLARTSRSSRCRSIAAARLG